MIPLYPFILQPLIYKPSCYLNKKVQKLQKGLAMFYLTFFSYVLLLIKLSSLSADADGFCSVPVADLIGTPMHVAQQQNLPIQQYKDQPYANASNASVCTRLSQLLFNESVKILKEVGDELYVEILHWYHIAGNPPKKQTTYWTHKNNITRFDTLSPLDLSKIPGQISFLEQNFKVDDIVTLKNFFHDKKSNLVYSAGTRFVKAKEQNQKKYCSVFAFNPTTKSFSVLNIPKKICLENILNNPIEKRKLFVQVLKEWSNQKGFIPYVFGGASIGMPFDQNRFKEKNIKHNNKKISYYKRSTKTEYKYGADCAHTIARAAHIAQIPLFIKNTTTFKQELTPLKAQDTIENGDIIVWQGHTVVISDIQKGLLIEARGYNHGYGILQEIPFSEQFQNIFSMQDLKDAYLHKTQINRLDKRGKIVQTITDLQIMKLPI